MKAVKARDTLPEMRVRSALHGLGYRFRLHRKDLPGRPDVVLPRWNTVIFVHGCFWHRHHLCKRASVPKTRTGFWLRKFEANVLRDKSAEEALQALGWKVTVIWECQTSNRSELEDRLASQLSTGINLRLSGPTVQEHDRDVRVLPCPPPFIDPVQTPD